MNVLSITGIKAAAAAKVVKGLNQLLADFQVYYTNLRGYHWHVRGPQFFTLHEQFEKMYDGAAEHIDEIAERILQQDQGANEGLQQGRYHSTHP